MSTKRILPSGRLQNNLSVCASTIAISPLGIVFYFWYIKPKRVMKHTCFFYFGSKGSIDCSWHAPDEKKPKP